MCCKHGKDLEAVRDTLLLESLNQLASLKAGVGRLGLTSGPTRVGGESCSRHSSAHLDMSVRPAGRRRSSLLRPSCGGQSSDNRQAAHGWFRRLAFQGSTAEKFDGALASSSLRHGSTARMMSSPYWIATSEPSPLNPERCNHSKRRIGDPDQSPANQDLYWASSPSAPSRRCFVTLFSSSFQYRCYTICSDNAPRPAVCGLFAIRAQKRRSGGYGGSRGRSCILGLQCMQLEKAVPFRDRFASASGILFLLFPSRLLRVGSHHLNGDWLARWRSYTFCRSVSMLWAQQPTSCCNIFAPNVDPPNRRICISLQKQRLLR